MINHKTSYEFRRELILKGLTSTHSAFQMVNTADLHDFIGRILDAYEDSERWRQSYKNALVEIRDQDYRGNRSAESQIANTALNE
jgi:hypothetical protein